MTTTPPSPGRQKPSACCTVPRTTASALTGLGWLGGRGHRRCRDRRGARGWPCPAAGATPRRAREQTPSAACPQRLRPSSQTCIAGPVLSPKLGAPAPSPIDGDTREVHTRGSQQHHQSWRHRGRKRIAASRHVSDARCANVATVGADRKESHPSGVQFITGRSGPCAKSARSLPPRHVSDAKSTGVAAVGRGWERHQTHTHTLTHKEEGGPSALPPVRRPRPPSEAATAAAVDKYTSGQRRLARQQPCGAHTPLCYRCSAGSRD